MANKMFIGIGALVFIIVVALAAMSALSRNIPATGLQDNKLQPCPDTPNCLCSEYQGSHHTQPVAINNSGINIQRYIEIIKSMNGELVSFNENYLHATFTTTVMRFIDDFELRIDKTNMLVHIRSASRVGYSDLGKNKNRVSEFKALLQTTKHSKSVNP